jgi:CMP-N-acetylneuraminic acid synthetase
MKGHSERVPAKNMRSFAGKPLFFHVLETLLRSRYIAGVLINTDSEHIAALAEPFERVRVIRRPEALRGDCVPMNDIIAYDMAHVSGEHFLQTHSTSPLLSVETLDRAVAEYLSGLPGQDSLFSVTRLQARLYDGNGPLNHDPALLVRTQDLPPIYEENSNMYLFSRGSFAAAGGRRIGLAPRMFPMSRLEAIDIDEPDDFMLAEALHKTRATAEIHHANTTAEAILAWVAERNFYGANYAGQ